MIRDCQGGRSPADDKPGVQSRADQILLVDDNPDMLKIVSRMSRSLGFAPTSVSSGTEALNLLRKTHYDILLSDFEMPVINGYELALKVKQLLLDTRVIIMTGRSPVEVDHLVQDVKIVDGVLFKPFTMRALKAVLDASGSERLTGRMD